MQTQIRKEQIKELAQQNGFSTCGISAIEPMVAQINILENWLNNSYQGSMKYLEKNIDKRKDPAKLVEGAKSVISVLQNYYPGKSIQFNSDYKISRYAYGKDYHTVIKNKLKKLADDIKAINGDFTYRMFTDSAPVFDKAWAQKAGLGWIGKNTCLINKSLGSFFFIGHIICDLELETDQEFEKSYCGNCTRCIDACPNQALVAPYELDSRKCISYLTIEHKNKTPEELKGRTHSWIFGCDICQDVCPWNKSPAIHDEPQFLPGKELLEMTNKDWEELDQNRFNRLFRETAIEWTGYESLSANIKAVKLL